MNSEIPSLVELIVIVAVAVLAIGFVLWRESVKDKEGTVPKKRIVYEVQWLVSLGEWGIVRDGELFAAGFSTKGAAILRARRAAKREWTKTHQPTELIIKTKAGRIGKGSSSRSTFGLDPRSSRG